MSIVASDGLRVVVEEGNGHEVVMLYVFLLLLVIGSELNAQWPP